MSDSDMLASTGEDMTIRLWSPALGHMLTILSSKEMLTSLLYMGDGKSLVAGTYEGEI